MGKTTIEWTDATWNPVRGCALVSEGCRRCYAMKQAHRFSGPGQPYEGLTELGPDGPRWTGHARPIPEMLEEPLHWKKPRRVFVNSMSDLFHEDVPFEFIRRVYHTMALANQHAFQILTKRPERMLEFTKWCAGPDDISAAYWPRNCWLGVSVEDQKTANERIPLLLQTPAAVRFVSYEPALGAVDFSRFMPCVRAIHHGECEAHPRLHWLIIGGESGPGARPFNLQWARDVIAQCRAAGVAAFFKQAGSLPIISEDEWRSGYAARPGHVRILNAHNHTRMPKGFVSLLMHDRKGGDPSEWPEDLRIREFPDATE